MFNLPLLINFCIPHFLCLPRFLQLPAFSLVFFLFCLLFLIYFSFPPRIRLYLLHFSLILSFAFFVSPSTLSYFSPFLLYRALSLLFLLFLSTDLRLPTSYSALRAHSLGLFARFWRSLNIFQRPISALGDCRGWMVSNGMIMASFGLEVTIDDTVF